MAKVDDNQSLFIGLFCALRRIDTFSVSSSALCCIVENH